MSVGLIRTLSACQCAFMWPSSFIRVPFFFGFLIACSAAGSILMLSGSVKSSTVVCNPYL